MMMASLLMMKKPTGHRFSLIDEPAGEAASPAEIELVGEQESGGV